MLNLNATPSNKIRLYFLHSVFSVFILFLGISQIYGQRSCLPNLNYQDLPYWRASYIFTGVVEKFAIDSQAALQAQQNPNSDTYTLFNNRVGFNVEKEYRGTVDKNLEIISSFNFKEGEEYFVYAIQGKDGKIYQLENGECGKLPILLKDAKEDIEYAEEIATGKSGTRIYGSVTESITGTARQIFPLNEIEVTIKNSQNTFTTKTDVNGKYIFKNIPVGEYEITAEIPQGMHKKPIRNNWRDNKSNIVFIGKGVSPYLPVTLASREKPEPFYFHSDSYNFHFSAQSSIEGRLVDFDGNISPQQYVWLIPTYKGKAYLEIYTQYLWTNPADGKFVFNDVPKGEYTIVVNRNNCHSNNHPEYSRNFFPGVSDLENAEIITVGENQNLKLNDFKLSPTLKERLFSGVVLNTDKKPVANATVFLITSNQKNPNECFSVNIETKTDEFGQFQLKGYESYEYKIRAYIQPTDKSSSRLFSSIMELSDKNDVKNIELTIDSLNY